MTFLPVQTSAAAAWAISDYRQRTAQTPGAAGGACQVDFGQVPQDEMWMVDRIVVQSTSSTATVCFLYLDAVDDTQVLDGTRAGNFNVADEASAIQIPGGSTLIVRWSGASNGAVGSVRIQYTVLKRRS